MCIRDRAWIEDFETNGTIDPFLTISPGGVLAPNSSSGLGAPITDSVDADDGTIDGNGNDGYSYFADGVRSVTIEYMTGVRAAGVVFTDGDSRSTNIRLEAFDTMGNLLGTIDAGDLADDVFTGQTAEDRFLGFTDDMTPIGSITLSMDAGIGIEIDHVHWQTPTVPEPSSQCLALFALIGLVQLRRVRR